MRFQEFWGVGEKGYLFSGRWGILVIILGELGSKHILLEIYHFTDHCQNLREKIRDLV